MQKNVKNMYKHQHISISYKTKIPLLVYDRRPQFHVSLSSLSWEQTKLYPNCCGRLLDDSQGIY